MLSGLYARLIAAAIALAIVLGGFWYVHSLRKEIAELKEANVVLSTKLKSQNDAIEQWKKDADARLAAAQADLDKAKEEAAKAKGKATIIYKSKPSTPGDACKSALDLINGVK